MKIDNKRTCPFCKIKFKPNAPHQVICMSDRCKAQRNREAVKAYREKQKTGLKSLDSSFAPVGTCNKFLLGG